MALLSDPIPVFNLVVCIIIVILGFLCYLRSREHLPAYIGAAFGLFGISHAATILGLTGLLTVPLIIDRALAYLLVIFALIMHLRRTAIAKEAQQAWVEFFQEETQPVPESGGEDRKEP